MWILLVTKMTERVSWFDKLASYLYVCFYKQCCLWLHTAIFAILAWTIRHLWSYSKSESLPYNYAVEGEFSPNTKTSYRLWMGVHVSGALASEMDQSQERCFIFP